MKSEMAQEVFSLIQVACGRPSAVEFELAYQARVAMDRIRFAIKVTEDPDTRQEQLREARLQLLDALDRLKTAEYSFQGQFRPRRGDGNAERQGQDLNSVATEGSTHVTPVTGHGRRRIHEPTNGFRARNGE